MSLIPSAPFADFRHLIQGHLDQKAGESYFLLSIKISQRFTLSSFRMPCSAQRGCSRVSLEKSRFGPAEEIARNVPFMTRRTSNVRASRQLFGSSAIRSTTFPRV